MVAFVVQLCASIHSHVNLNLKILFKKKEKYFADMRFDRECFKSGIWKPLCSFKLFFCVVFLLVMEVRRAELKTKKMPLGLCQ